MHKNAEAMFAASFDPNDFVPGRYERLCSYFSYTAYVANAIAEAVTDHLRQNPTAQPRDAGNPADLALTLLEFFNGKISEEDGLQLTLVPEGATTDHPWITPGKCEQITGSWIANAMNMMLGVPTVPESDANGKIANFNFAKDFFFQDIAGLQRWLMVRTSRRAA